MRWENVVLRMAAQVQLMLKTMLCLARLCNKLSICWAKYNDFWRPQENFTTNIHQQGPQKLGLLSVTLSGSHCAARIWNWSPAKAYCPACLDQMPEYRTEVPPVPRLLTVLKLVALQHKPFPWKDGDPWPESLDGLPRSRNWFNFDFGGKRVAIDQLWKFWHWERVKLQLGSGWRKIGWRGPRLLSAKLTNSGKVIKQCSLIDPSLHMASHESYNKGYTMHTACKDGYCFKANFACRWETNIWLPLQTLPKVGIVWTRRN